MILKGELVSLRGLHRSDFDSFLKWHSDYSIRFNALMHPFPISEAMEESWFEKVQNDISNRKVVFTILNNKTSSAIGYLSLVNIDYISKYAFLGIVIGDESCRGKGYGNETMRIALNYAFSELALLKVYLEVLQDNNGAIKLYRKVGFREEGLFSNMHFFNGRFHNVIRMSCFREDFSKIIHE
jgi:UDP-4-amino-4,6-dideoxy-N-acetyl-beta-L-altrosamine N-acetyltransferase